MKSINQCSLAIQKVNMTRHCSSELELSEQMKFEFVKRAVVHK